MTQKLPLRTVTVYVTATIMIPVTLVVHPSTDEDDIRGAAHREATEALKTIWDFTELTDSATWDIEAEKPYLTKVDVIEQFKEEGGHMLMHNGYADCAARRGAWCDLTDRLVTEGLRPPTDENWGIPDHLEG